ncbi:hypothetical protein MetMK1DRAFT_00024210 [Metallosphaera yellowstonensis MK1]|uniref:Uncharacterized protein n=1 Tax=Metallosphaera yellowstonensis MK1 TaxID=671065 RepID=H2C772_9CREN|nr:hypothetical protein MetMK1DRAFT_00024210 [Metallosphaera yellowstonensis MK1]
MTRKSRGEFTKKRSYFKFKVFVVTLPTLIHRVQVELANFPDNWVDLTLPGHKVVDRGFRGMSSTRLIEFPFTRHVEFFSFLRRYWRSYAVNRDTVELFVRIMALVHNSLIYTSVLSRVLEGSSTDLVVRGSAGSVGNSFSPALCYFI